MLKKASLKQKGFTLIELLVAMAIAAVLLTAIVTIFRTSIHMNSSIDNQTNATNQLKNAFNYIDRDAEEAGSVVPTNTNQFPLTLKWIQNNLDETIIYSISNSGLLQRYQYQSGVLQSTMNVANYVNTNSAQTNCTWDNTNYVLTVNMTVSIGAINTSRQFIITPRVVQGAISLATSITTMSATPTPSGFGQSVMFTAVVTGSSGTPTGIVTFFDNGTTQLGTGNLSGGQASYSTSILSQGSHSITAAYSGDAQYNQSTSSVWTQTVNQTSSSTAVTSSVNPSTYGSSVTFTATVAPNAAAGTVTFKDGSTTLGTGTLSSGTATYTTSILTVGGHSITAVYGGDTNDAGSTSSALSQTVNKGSSSVSVTSSANPSIATVTPSAATGTVTFMDSATTLGTGTLSSGQAIYAISSLSVAGSPHSITAVYGGDANYGGSTSSVLSQNVTNVTATFGITTTGSSTSTNLGDSTIEATTGNRGAGNIEAWDKFTTTAPLTITSFTMYQNTAGSGHMHVGLYIDSSGPSQLVAGSDSGSISVSNSTGWVTYSYGTAFNLPAGTYWIVFTFDTAQSNFNERNTTGTQYYKLNVGYGSLPASFPSGSTSTTNGPTSMYFTGTQVKGYAEATQVTLSTNNANISSLSFYSYSTGNARLAIYSNSGSAPSSLQWQSNDSSISIGWNTINISSGTPTSLTLQSGTFWLAWQWNSVSSGPSYSTGSNNSGNYIVLTYGSFPATWSGGTSTTENWSIYGSYH